MNNIIWKQKNKIFPAIFSSLDPGWAPAPPTTPCVTSGGTWWLGCGRAWPQWRNWAPHTSATSEDLARPPPPYITPRPPSPSLSVRKYNWGTDVEFPPSESGQTNYPDISHLEISPRNSRGLIQRCSASLLSPARSNLESCNLVIIQFGYIIYIIIYGLVGSIID